MFADSHTAVVGSGIMIFKPIDYSITHCDYVYLIHNGDLIPFI